MLHLIRLKDCPALAPSLSERGRILWPSERQFEASARGCTDLRYLQGDIESNAEVGAAAKQNVAVAPVVCIKGSGADSGGQVAQNPLTCCTAK